MLWFKSLKCALFPSGMVLQGAIRLSPFSYVVFLLSLPPPPMVHDVCLDPETIGRGAHFTSQLYSTDTPFVVPYVLLLLFQFFILTSCCCCCCCFKSLFSFCCCCCCCSLPFLAICVIPLSNNFVYHCLIGVHYCAIPYFKRQYKIGDFSSHFTIQLSLMSLQWRKHLSKGIPFQN